MTSTENKHGKNCRSIRTEEPVSEQDRNKIITLRNIFSEVSELFWMLDSMYQMSCCESFEAFRKKQQHLTASVFTIEFEGIKSLVSHDKYTHTSGT